MCNIYLVNVIENDLMSISGSGFHVLLTGPIFRAQIIVGIDAIPLIFLHGVNPHGVIGPGLAGLVHSLPLLKAGHDMNLIPPIVDGGPLRVAHEQFGGAGRRRRRRTQNLGLVVVHRISHEVVQLLPPALAAQDQQPPCGHVEEHRVGAPQSQVGARARILPAAQGLIIAPSLPRIRRDVILVQT